MSMYNPYKAAGLHYKDDLINDSYKLYENRHSRQYLAIDSCYDSPDDYNLPEADVCYDEAINIGDDIPF